MGYHQPMWEPHQPCTGYQPMCSFDIRINHISASVSVPSRWGSQGRRLKQLAVWYPSLEEESDGCMVLLSFRSAFIQFRQQSRQQSHTVNIHLPTSGISIIPHRHARGPCDSGNPQVILDSVKLSDYSTLQLHTDSFHVLFPSKAKNPRFT